MPAGLGLRTGERGETGRPMIAPEQALWSSVLQLAISDSMAKTNTGTRISARVFLEHGRTLPQILGLLDIDPEWFADRCMPVLRRRWSEIDCGREGRSGTGGVTVAVQVVPRAPTLILEDRPCIHGHRERYASNGDCRACHRIRLRRAYQEAAAMPEPRGRPPGVAEHPARYVV